VIAVRSGIEVGEHDTPIGYRSAKKATPQGTAQARLAQAPLQGGRRYLLMRTRDCNTGVLERVARELR
jgi:hypothetical protein